MFRSSRGTCTGATWLRRRASSDALRYSVSRATPPSAAASLAASLAATVMASSAASFTYQAAYFWRTYDLNTQEAGNSDGIARDAGLRPAHALPMIGRSLSYAARIPQRMI